MDLYERFLTKENFELAYSRLKYAPNNAYKFFYEKDLDVFGFLLGNNIEQLINDIKSNKYKPQKVCRYYVPKKNYLTRPISLLNFIDLIVYQAIANVFMDEVQDDFSVLDKLDSSNEHFPLAKVSVHVLKADRIRKKGAELTEICDH